MSKLIAPCGIDCKDCYAYIATQTDDMEMKQKMVEDFKQRHGIEKQPHEMECDGCRAEGRHLGFCAICGIRACADEKGYVTCAECAEFPCDKGSFIWKENSVSKANLEELRK